MSTIHPTAIVERGAELGRNIRIGPFSYIGAHVQLGDDCELRNNVTIVGHTRIEGGNVFFQNCVIGEAPQDIKYKGEKTETIIGQDNHFREMVTVHAGTVTGSGVTQIGSHNRFLVGVHIAHDNCIGNHIVISNYVQIAGHVHIEDYVTMGGQSGIHHFVTVGQYAMLGGLSRVSCDVPPYMITSGYPAEVRGLNFHGLKRWNLSEDQIDLLAQVYKQLYGKRSETSGTFTQRLTELTRTHTHSPHVQYLCSFIQKTLSVGNSGRYLESQRKDTLEDSQHFFKRSSSEE